MVTTASVPARQSSGWVPWFVLMVSLSLTALAAWYVYHSNSLREQNRFHVLTDAAVDQLNGAVDDYIAGLRGAAGLFNAVDGVTAEQFRRYVTDIDLPRRYPAVRAFAFAQRVQPQQMADFVAQHTKTNPGFKVFPQPVTGEAYIGIFAEPITSQRAKVGNGFNLLSEPSRKLALEKARDTGQACATTRIRLVSQNPTDPAGAFVIYLPVYTPGPPPVTVQERRDRIFGVVIASFLAPNFFQHVFDSEVRGRLQIAVHDQDDSHLLYDPAASETVHGKPPHLHESRPLDMAGQQWILEMTERPDFDVESGEPLTPLILLGGAGISLVLFAVSRAQSLAQTAAERNATALTASSAALRVSQARLRRLVDSNLIGVFFFNSEGQITDGNDEFHRLIGRSQPPPVALNFSDILTPEDLSRQQEIISQLKTTGLLPPREGVFVRQDGSTIPILIGCALVDPKDGDAVAFTIDLTERKQAERDLRAAKDAAEYASRSKDQFLAVLSHELRTPLTPVLALTAAATTDPSTPPAYREELAMIHRNVELEAKLIDDLLDLTRIGRGKLQLLLSTVDLEPVIRGAVEVCSGGDFQQKNIVIRQQLQAGAHHVHGDAARLQQVFWNLVKNSIKFTPTGGTITVKCYNSLSSDPEKLPDLIVEVADTGIGIEREMLPKVFDAFEQGATARLQASGGLGLGLAISRGLVEAHGGEITVHSDGPGKGALFTVRLPTVAAPQEAGPSASPTAPPPSAPLRILLVEDHVDTAKILARLLRHVGHSVEVAASVHQSLEIAAEKEFDLLVSDLGLPDGTGFDVIQGFRRVPHNSGKSAIALTGFGAETDVLRTAQAGFDDHLTKPVSFQNLQNAIDRVMGYKAKLNGVS